VREGDVTAYFASVAALALVMQGARLAIAWADHKRKWAKPYRAPRGDGRPD
jgi:hypothetical protein